MTRIPTAILTALLLFIVSVSVAGCSFVRPGPDAIVLKAFDYYVGGDSAAITDLMSEEGRRNADLYCSGAAANCLKRNYASFGTLSSRSAEVTSKSDKSAEVVLRTSWNGQQGAISLCQVFQLQSGDSGWAIRFFEVPKSCS